MGTVEVLSGPTHRRLVAQAMAAYAIAGGVMIFLVVLVVGVSDAPLPKFQEGSLSVLGLASLAVGAVLWWNKDRIPSWALHPAFFSAITTISLAAYFAGPSGGPTAATLYIGVAVAMVIMLGQRAAVVYIAIIGVAYFLVLLAQPETLAIATRWVAVVGLSALLAGIAGWIAGEIRVLAAAEQRSRAEQELATADLETLTRRKREFLANMSHELRTPLNAIIGFGEVLAQEIFGPLNPRQYDYVRDIVGSGRQLLALINDILDLAKIDAGRMELALEDVSVHEMLRQVASRFMGDAARSDVDIAVVVDPDAGTVMADRRRVAQVLDILVSNALRFSPHGSSVAVRAIRGDDGVLVAVGDNGPGVDPKDHGRIFEEFGQLTPDLASPGPGLGLPLARAFVELHHGRLDVISEPEQHGSVFVFMIPFGDLALPSLPPVPNHPAGKDLVELSRTIWSQAGIFEVLLGTRRHRKLIARGSALYSGFGGVLMLLGSYLGHDVLPGFNRDAVTALGIYCVVVACALLAVGDRLLGRQYTAIAVVSSATISLLAYFVGPVGGPIAACGYVALGIGVFLYLPPRWALEVIVSIAVGYAVVLAAQGGSVGDGIARWLVTVGNVAATGLLVSWVAGRVRALAEAAYAARAAADRAQAELEAANDDESAFLAKMSHELRTPLNAIIGFSEVLADGLFGSLNEKQAEYIGDIVGGGRHLLALTNEILDLSKVESGSHDLEPTVFDLPPSLTSCAAMFREQARRQRVELRVDVDPDIGFVEADERKIQQVVFNLLSNAVKFTAPGGEVHLIARRADSNVSIVVTDTGVGIDRADQGGIFDDFVQASSKPAGAPAGTGLGLGLAKRFVDLHRGELELTSAPGEGTTVEVRLPIGNQDPLSTSL